MNDKLQKKEQNNLRRKTEIDLSTMVYGKVPPQAKDLEVAVLGAIMLERSAYDIAAGILKAECFYVEAHQLIFKAFMNLSLNGIPIDILTVVEALKATNNLDLVGGPYYVTKLTNAVVSTAHMEAHCRIIAQKFIQRELIRISGEIITEAYDDGTDVFDLFDKAESSLFKISNHFFQTNYESAALLAAKNMNQIDALQSREIDLTGVPTGYPALDRLTCGWQPTDLIILAARPSVGKTALALNLAINAADSKIKPTGVGIFSLEMSSSQLTNRIISYISKVNLDRIIRGRMNDEEYNRYMKGVGEFSKMNIQIDDSGTLNIHQLRGKARQMVQKEKVGMIIIDYIQLMSGEGQRNGNREQEISTISRGLKALAKELTIPVIALSQMSRAIEKRADQEPVLSDLRESGAIEQDADVVAFPMRADYGMNQNTADPTLANKAYIKFAKHRNGTLEKLAFETDLSTQSWTEYNSFGNNWRPLTPAEVRPARSQEFDGGYEGEAPF